MASRTRTRLGGNNVGLEESTQFSPVVNTFNVPLERHVCADATGRSSDHNVKIEHTRLGHIRPLAGERNIGSGKYKRYTNFVSPVHESVSRTHATLSMPSTSSDAVKLIARSNPSRPTVSVFNFIYELKDLPGMLKDVWAFKSGVKSAIRSHRDFANHQLSLQMGWAPMISDLMKMSEFSVNVDRKVDELQRLYSKGGLKRRIRLGQYSANEQTNAVTIASGIGDSIVCKVNKQTNAIRWGTIRWTPTSLPRVSPGDAANFRKYARALVLGDTGGPLGPLRMSNLWNAIPWSWLIDWFTNVGDYMIAYDNSVPCTHSTPCIMTQTQTAISWTRIDSYTDYKGGDGASTYITKERVVTSGSLQASLPFLSGRQLSILSGLALQRIRLSR